MDGLLPRVPFQRTERKLKAGRHCGMEYARRSIMPRSRMIKPEFWDDEKLARVSRDSRLLFVGLWTHSDDFGVVKGNHVWLKNKIFPYDEDLSIQVFSSWVNKLESSGFIIGFDTDDEKYYYIVHFDKHQKVDHPSKQRNPEPPKDILSRETREPSRITRVETETESETETETKTVGTPVSAKPRRGRTYRIGLDREQRAWTGISLDDIDLWAKTYPAVDIKSALNETLVFWLEHPKNKRLNWGATIVSRLGVLQEKSRPSQSNSGNRPNVGFGIESLDEKRIRINREFDERSKKDHSAVDAYLRGEKCPTK